MEEKKDINKEPAEETVEKEVVAEEPQPEPHEKKKKSEKGDKTRHRDEELKALQARMDEVSDKYVRLAAEFDNYRRRTAKERLELISTAGEDVIKGMLPVLDDCERALQVLRESGSDKAAIEGTELRFNKLMNRIVDVIQQGYMLNDKVIRFAKVVVGV